MVDFVVSLGYDENDDTVRSYDTLHPITRNDKRKISSIRRPPMTQKTCVIQRYHTPGLELCFAP